MNVTGRVVWAGLALCVTASAEFRISYFHDEDRSSMAFAAISAGSDNCVVAVGAKTERDRAQPFAVVSSDGGKTWQERKLKEAPRSIHMLNARLGFLATEKGVWRTGDCGLNWEKVGKQRDLIRIQMLDESHGFAAGFEKLAVSTTDGGRTWKPIPAAAEPKSSADRTAYTTVDFWKGRVGVISGFHTPRRRQLDFPPWMDPESAKARAQWPSVNLILVTGDGGATWHASESSLLGKIYRFRVGPGSQGLVVVEFEDAFEFPSQVFRIDLGSKKTEPVFAVKGRLVSDALTFDSGAVVLATIEQAGQVANLPIPGKLRIIQQENSENKAWTEFKSDYRASARRAFLAASASGQMWCATDTGMILRHNP